jgi:2-oxoglutarate ferredoxin oxidoreductase subunit alpha
VEDFIHSHEKVFIIEQNRDGQMRSLLINELNVNPQKMVPVLNYDGMPITAHTIISLISKILSTALNGSTSKILS